MWQEHEQAMLDGAPNDEVRRALANLLERRHLRSFDPKEVPSLSELQSLDAEHRWIYFIQCADGPIKIGLATDVTDRLSTLQVGCPYELTLFGCFRGGPLAEQALHLAFAALRLRGEWFMAPPPARKVLRRLLGIDDQGRKR